ADGRQGQFAVGATVDDPHARHPAAPVHPRPVHECSTDEYAAATGHPRPAADNADRDGPAGVVTVRSTTAGDARTQMTIAEAAMTKEARNQRVRASEF